MGVELKPGADAAGSSADLLLARRFWLALGLYAVLGALAWFTLDAAPVEILGRPVDLRLVVLLVLGGLLLRTVVAKEAEKIRRGSGSGREGL